MKIGQSCRNKKVLSPCRCSFGDARRQGQGKTQGRFESQRQEQNFNSLLSNFLFNLKLPIAKILKFNSNKKIDSNFSFIFYCNRRYRWKIQRRLIHYDLKPKMFLDHYHFWQKIS